MVERILSMLSQFLISNQSLEIDNSFRIYLKILSIDHMSIKKRETRQHKKQTKEFFKLRKKKTFGAKTNKAKFNFLWALDIPNSFHGEVLQNSFENKCLLLCTILGILQHELFEKKVLFYC